MSWQLQEAKQKFSMLVRQALVAGPQVVTRHGEPVVVVVSADEFERMRTPKADFKTFLLSVPEEIGSLQLERNAELAREITL